MRPRRSPGGGASASPPEKAPDDAADVTDRLAHATLDAAATTPVAARTAAAAGGGAEPRTPATREFVVGALPHPLSPALEVCARADEQAFGSKKVTFETSSGLGFQANVRAHYCRAPLVPLCALCRARLCA